MQHQPTTQAQESKIVSLHEWKIKNNHESLGNLGHLSVTDLLKVTENIIKEITTNGFTKEALLLSDEIIDELHVRANQSTSPEFKEKFQKLIQNLKGNIIKLRN